MVNRFYSNGKLLLTGEYVVLDGAKSLAVPTQFGQDLIIEPTNSPELIWKSFTNEGVCWFEATFDLPKLRLITATFTSNKEGNTDGIAETLQGVLQNAQQLNPNFLQATQGCLVKTYLTFPQNWGLGSSSTLINNIANWATVDAFTLLRNTFSGSGYDIACAKTNSPIYYQLINSQPVITPIDYCRKFSDDLFFVHLNQKQNSREGIAMYKKSSQTLSDIKTAINEVSLLTDAFVNATSVNDLNRIVVEHEKIIGAITKQQPIKKRLFNDYFGEIKSLGAWGGDFVLATGNTDTLPYFNSKGYNTVLRYKDIIL